MWRLRAPLLALLLMQVILLASSGVTATKKPLGKQETCNMKNHMIEYLRNNGVQIYERPQISSKACLKEWDSFGTCCEVSSIQSVISKKIELNNHALAKLTHELESVVPAVKNYYKKYVTDPLAKMKHQQSQIGNGVTFKTAIKGVNPFVFSMEDTYQSLLQSVEASITPSVIEHQRQCVAKFNEVISKSACSICSGRSDDFFSWDSRLAISEPTCRAVLRACSLAWTSMTKIPETVRLATQAVRRLSNGHNLKLTFNDPEELGFTMNLDSFITNRNLIPIMKKCGEEVADCSFEHVAALCEQFIHIQAPTYIESSQSQILSILSKISSAKESLETILGETNTAIETLRNIKVFTLTHLDSMRSSVRALQTIQNNLVQISQIWVTSQMQLVRLKHLFAEEQSRTHEVASQTNSLIADAYKAMRTFLLAKHDYLLQVTLESKPAERIRVKLMGDPEPNPAVSSEATTVRQEVEKLWNSFHLALEIMRHPTVDPKRKFGTYISSQNYIWVHEKSQEARLTKILLESIYQDLYQELVGSDKVKQAEVKRRYGMLLLLVPTPRKLTILRQEPNSTRFRFTMETIVVKDRAAVVDIASQPSGVVVLGDSP